MAKKPKPEGKKYSYMDTYGDLVTLLMCFFVLLFAMSTVEEEKYNAFAAALSQTFGPTTTTAAAAAQAPAQTPAENQQQDASEQVTGDLVMNPDQTLPEDFSQIGEAIEKYVEEQNLQGSVSVEVGESGATFIRIQDNLLFAGNSSALQPAALEFLDFLGESLLAVQDQVYRANFIGHTASIAGSGVDDWILSCDRSGTVASYFERTIGFSAGKMETTGYGRHYPIADNQTAEGIAKNRRVDIVVVSNNTDTLLQALGEASRIYFPEDSTEFYEGDPADLPEYTLNNLPPTANLDGLTDSQVDALNGAVDEVRTANGDS